MDSKNLTFYIIATIASLIGALGDSYLNYWAKREGAAWPSFFIGVGACNVAILLFSRMLTLSSLARTAILFLVANSLAIALISFCYFREQLSPYQWLGIAVALSGIILMEIGK